MKLYEVFNAMLPWAKNQHSGNGLVQYDFKSEDLHYEVMFQKISPERGQTLTGDPNPTPGGWLVEFSALTGPGGKDGYGLINSGNSVPVFATILNIISSFRREYSPIFFTFLAKEKSRQSLYTRMANRLGGNVQTSVESDGQLRFIVRLP